MRRAQRHYILLVRARASAQKLEPITVRGRRTMSLAEWQSRANVRGPMPSRTPYHRPVDVTETTLKEVLAVSGRAGLEEPQYDILRKSVHHSGGKNDVRVFLAGDQSLLTRKCVSVVGTREVSEAEVRGTLARELADLGVIVVSGLAKGVDTAALSSAIKAGGKTPVVIGTPLSKADPPGKLCAPQETIWKQHLLISPFTEGETVFRSNFPKRNRVMAAISDATVIIEASDTSGTLHQAAECQRLGRWLFIARSVADDPNLKWPQSFLGQPNTAVLERTTDILAAIEIR